MKKLFFFIMLAISLIVAPAKAQTTDGYLTDGDIVSISYTSSGDRTYLQASGNGVGVVAEANDNCLWEIGIIQNGSSYTYTFRSVSTERFLIVTGNRYDRSLALGNSEAVFYIQDANNNEEKKYISGKFYYEGLVNRRTISFYINRGFEMSNRSSQTTLFVEKWERKGATTPTANFSPAKIEYTYAEDDNVATSQATAVSFQLEPTTETYYQCVNRPEEVLLNRQTVNVDPSDVSNVQIYWLSKQDSKGKESVLDISTYTSVAAEENADRTLMTLSAVTKNNYSWQFTITPIGKSPMGLQDSEGWIDYVDNVVAEYTYQGNILTQRLRVVRKAYHEEELPELVFSINPVTYTFFKDGETKAFNVTMTHQHGSVIYNLDNQVIDVDYSYDPVHVKLNEFNTHFSSEELATWTKEYAFQYQNGSAIDWLTMNESEFTNNGNIYVTAEANETESKRSANLVVTLTKDDGFHPHSGSFTIPLHQRGVEGGIQFYTQSGEGATQTEKENWNRVTDQQKVHTAERIIYYKANEDVELRLAEPGYGGYMRWYDYETGMDPYYNELPKDSTSWVLSPRVQSSEPFAAINTPQSPTTIDTEGRSYGLYAVNQASGAAVGGVINQNNTDNPAPIIKGWADGAAHIMACDVSAYTDYEIVVENGQIKSITEPTLSYRQLFHLRPASEIADKFENLGDGKYLEEYHYQAPAGKQVLLSTEHRYKKYRSHVSEMCYFYKGTGGELYRIDANTPVVWQESTLQNDGTYTTPIPFNTTYTAEIDYLIVSSTTYPVRKVYTLTLPAGAGTGNQKELLIARFVVDFVDREQHGPTTKTIMTQQRINNEFNILEHIDFDDASTHLPWHYSTYGYVYTAGDLANTANYKRKAQEAFPFFGEYTILDEIDKSWAIQDALEGSALFVDGTMEPGLVASLSTKAVICAGQTLYCSAWFCNPAPTEKAGNGNPIFRCNVQGRNMQSIDQNGDTLWGEWQNAGVYFVGELNYNSGWQQIVFPIESAHGYDETRVSIYNFATTNRGNDFMVDEITLFVSRLPITAYQGKMACRTTQGENTSAAAVLRLDYSNINAGADGYMYYQIYNESYENQDGSIGAPVVLSDPAAYYHEAHSDEDHPDDEDIYGSVRIPEVGYVPKVENDDKIYESVSQLLDDMVAKGENNAKAYVLTNNQGAEKWLMYVAHIIDNTTNESNALTQLYDKQSYSMRMAYAPDELAVPECNLQTPLHATQQTVFTLRNSDEKVIKHNSNNGVLTADDNGNMINILNNSNGNCANDLYFLTANVVNNMAIESGGELERISAPIFADWLVGDAKGDVLSEQAPTKGADETDEAFNQRLNDYNARLAQCIVDFKEFYGFTHDQVATAILYDMRRNVPENTNYHATSFEELDPATFLTTQNYEIVKHLYDNGWLQLYDTTVYFYLGSEDVARYWCFPIDGTAKTTIEDAGGNDVEVTLRDCNEPRRVKITASASGYTLNLMPLAANDLTSQQKMQLPKIKVVADATGTFSIPIEDDQISDNVVFVQNADPSLANLNLNSLPDYIKFFDIATGEVIDRPTITPGEEYTLRIQLMDRNGWTHIEGNDDACRIGYVFITVQIVPKILIWQPTGQSFNGWGKDENWKGWNDKNENGVVDKDELTDGYVPTGGTNVVIPNLNNPLLYPYIVPDETHNHYPTTIDFAPHTCGNIYFAAGAHIQNQYLLEYEKAFVDMPITAGRWNMMSAPLQYMYSGDIYVPHTGSWNDGNSQESTDPFEVNGFAGQRHSDAAYAFWQTFYNQAVSNRAENDREIKQTVSAEFKLTNTMEQELKVGSGFQVYGLGPGSDGNTGTLTVRLPKPDTQYYYYSPDGDQTTQTTSELNRGTNSDVNNSHKLAYTPTKVGEDWSMDIELTNEVESEYFVFGNPTMAYINMHDFLHDNEGVLNHTFYRIENGAWDAETEHTMGDNRYLAPMNSVVLVAKDKVKKEAIEVSLKPEHLTLNNQVNPFSNDNPEVVIAPLAPRIRTNGSDESERMSIYALTDNAYAQTTLATHPVANDYYLVGEDALFVSSGIETSSYITTPMNMYTVAEQVPMMADVRQGISEIPLAILVGDDYRTSHMQLAFYLSANWSRECYLYDSKTGQKIRIMDGLVITVEMPQNHEQRYFIEGPDEYLGSSDDQGPTTAVDNTISSSASATLQAFSLAQGKLTVGANQLIQKIRLYDFAGRLILDNSLTLQHTTTTLNAPSGMCLVEALLRDGTTLYTQTLVK